MNEHVVVDDEEDIVELLDVNLKREGFRVSTALSGEQALTLIRAERPQLVVVDLMLPGLDGFDVCRAIKQDAELKGTVVIVLSAKGEEADIVAGLELGADDYVTKPFSSRVLVARMRSALRRRLSAPVGLNDELTLHNLYIHPGRHEVRLTDGTRPDLTATEFGLLHLLMRRPGWVFTRNQIVDHVRGTDHAVTDRAVDVQVVGLRRKLGEMGELIETVRGVGYRFKEV